MAKVFLFALKQFIFIPVSGVFFTVTSGLVSRLALELVENQDGFLGIFGAERVKTIILSPETWLKGSELKLMPIWGFPFTEYLRKIRAKPIPPLGLGGARKGLGGSRLPRSTRPHPRPSSSCPVPPETLLRSCLAPTGTLAGPIPQRPQTPAATSPRYGPTAHRVPRTPWRQAGEQPGLGAVSL